MKFLENSREEIEERYQGVMGQLPAAASEIIPRMQGLSREDADIALAQKYLYGSSPWSDIGNVPFETFLDFSRRSLDLWRSDAFVHDLPEYIFLRYILYHRVNEEEIQPCRCLFGRELKKYFEEEKGISEKYAEKRAGYGSAAGAGNGRNAGACDERGAKAGTASDAETGDRRDRAAEGRDAAACTISRKALAVNEWCARNMTYQSSDDRTRSALSVYKSGSGRCGEESVFAVNALRACGIPARQVYAPRWSHCDDNHAWVEVLTEGGWHFLGACEPEPALDMGWFPHAASRAMMIHSRNFFKKKRDETRADSFYQAVREEPLADSFGFAGSEGCVTLENQLPRYAKTHPVTVHIERMDGTPAAGAEVQACIYNYASFVPIGTWTADRNGNVTLITGYGSIYFIAVSKGRRDECLADARKKENFCIRLGEKTDSSRAISDMVPETNAIPETCTAPATNAIPETCTAPATNAIPEISVLPEINAVPGTSEIPEKNVSPEIYDAWKDIDISAPEDTAGPGPEITESEKILCRLQREECAGKLRRKQEDFIPAWKRYFFGCQDIQPAEKYMSVLTAKDHIDADPEVLADHILRAKNVREDYLDYLRSFPGNHHLSEADLEEMFLKYVFNPRISTEPLSAWRGPLLKAIGEEAGPMRQNPRLIREWILSRVIPEESQERSTVFTLPAAALKLGYASGASLDILCVAAARTLGIPARAEEKEKYPQFWKDGHWLAFNPQDDEKCTIIFESSETEEFMYAQNWSVSRWDGRKWDHIRLPDENWRTDIIGPKTDHTKGTGCGEMTVSLRSGAFLILTGQRLPNGNVLASRLEVLAGAGETKMINLRRRGLEMKDLFYVHPLPDMALTRLLPGSAGNENGRNEREETLLHIDRGSPAIVAALVPGEEPTEHILNEFCEDADRVKKIQDRLIFIIEKEDQLYQPVLQKTLKLFPKIQVYTRKYDDEMEMAQRVLFVTPGMFPFVFVSDGEGNSVYASSGYAVGEENILVQVFLQRRPPFAPPAGDTE